MTTQDARTTVRRASWLNAVTGDEYTVSGLGSNRYADLLEGRIAKLEEQAVELSQSGAVERQRLIDRIEELERDLKVAEGQRDAAEAARETLAQEMVRLRALDAEKAAERLRVADDGRRRVMAQYDAAKEEIRQLKAKIASMKADAAAVVQFVQGKFG